MISESRDAYFMKRTLMLARRGLGKTSPNPCVGACIVKNNNIVGEGYHRKAGEDHAEVAAFKNAGASVQGATLYVNLEPCSHYGRTPPCVQSIIDHNIKRVVVGCLDENPFNRGRGIASLRKAGISVTQGILEEEAKELNKPFFTFITQHRPYVTLKAAITIDGKIADYTGHSQWITSLASRQYVQHLRRQADAIVIGADTLKKDDPELTYRGKGAKTKQLKRIVLSTDLLLPFPRKMFSPWYAQEVMIATCCNKTEKYKAFEAKGVTFLNIKRGKHGIDEQAFLRRLGEYNIMHILIEGGSGVYSSFLSQGLVDRVVIMIAPKILGGKDAIGVFDGMQQRLLRDTIALSDIKIRRFGEDMCIEAEVGLSM